MESSSSSGLLKKANIRHGVSCLVDGCNSDLNQCRDYHRRHKVCEFHSKTPKVTIGGREQRFCQQCSRFHSLGEFDDGKRSCRKRLDSHNRRRRKPPSESISVSPGTFLPNQQGTTLLSFTTSTSQQHPITMVDSSWLENNVSGPYFHRHTFGGGNQFKIDYSNSEPHFSNQGSVSGNSNGYNITRIVDSDCALSLLSSTTTTAETRGIGFGHSLLPSVQYCEESVSSSSLIAHNNLQCNGLFQDGPYGRSANGPSPTLSFKRD